MKIYVSTMCRKPRDGERAERCAAAQEEDGEDGDNKRGWGITKVGEEREEESNVFTHPSHSSGRRRRPCVPSLAACQNSNATLNA